MAGQARTRISESAKNQYATDEEFLRIFDEDMNPLYHLSFLLTGDHQEGETCFVAGIERGANENRVFRQWARAWTKRVIVESAIRELQSRRSSNSSSLRSVFSHNRQSSSPSRHFDADAMLRLADFERFVFVMRVLERYRESECALLLGCAASQVRAACSRAIQALASIDQVVFGRFSSPIKRSEQAFRLLGKMFPSNQIHPWPLRGLFGAPSRPIQLPEPKKPR